MQSCRWPPPLIASLDLGSALANRLQANLNDVDMDSHVKSGVLSMEQFLNYIGLSFELNSKGE